MSSENVSFRSIRLMVESKLVVDPKLNSVRPSFAVKEMPKLCYFLASYGHETVFVGECIVSRGMCPRLLFVQYLLEC